MDMPNHALQTSQLLASSLHFWWIAFLRSSRDYWWICQENGKCLDDRLVKVWEDFGNVFQYETLSQWWQARGPALFDSPQMEMELIAALTSGLQLLLKQDLTTPRPGMLCVAIPLSLQAGAMSTAITSVFELARVRGEHYDKDARYQLTKAGTKGLHAIVPAYLTHALRNCVTHSKPDDQINKWGGYQMAKFLELCPQNNPKQGDSLALVKRKQNGMRTKHSQIAKTADELISNVEVGRFPCRKAVERRTRWTSMQIKDMDDAVASGGWKPYNWLEREHMFMLPENGIEHVAADGSEVHRNLALLTDLKGLEQPFLEPKRKRKK